MFKLIRFRGSYLLAGIGLTAMILLSFPSCSAPKSGCPAEEARAKAIKANKKVKKHSKTELFPKDMKKKMNH
jgi:hypothetical protein